MVGPHQIVIIFPAKLTTGQVCHVNIKPLTVKFSLYPQQIGTLPVILLHRMANPLKLLLHQQHMCWPKGPSL